MKLRKEMIEYVLEQGCAICKSQEGVELHHVYEPLKKPSGERVTSFKTKKGTIAEFITELSRCAPLCREHHLIVHRKGIRLTGVLKHSAEDLMRVLNQKQIAQGIRPSSFAFVPHPLQYSDEAHTEVESILKSRYCKSNDYECIQRESTYSNNQALHRCCSTRVAIAELIAEHRRWRENKRHEHESKEAVCA